MSRTASGCACSPCCAPRASGDEPSAQDALNDDGSLNVLTSSVEMGQGVKTALAILASGLLGFAAVLAWSRYETRNGRGLNTPLVQSADAADRYTAYGADDGAVPQFSPDGRTLYQRAISGPGRVMWMRACFQRLPVSAAMVSWSALSMSIRSRPCRGVSAYQYSSA